MSENKTYPAPEAFVAQANITEAEYEEMYRQSVDDPDGFWSEQAENYLSWFKPWVMAWVSMRRTSPVWQ